MRPETASQMRAMLKRDNKRKMARVKELRARGDKLALQHGDLMVKRVELFERLKLAIAEDRTAEVTKLRIEIENVTQEANELWNKLGKNEDEYWKVSNSIREGAYEKLKVANPAEFNIDMGRLRKGREDLQGGSDAFASMMGRGTLDGETITMYAAPGNRGHYSNDGVYLPPINRRRKIVVHELGHWLEDKDPDVHEKAVAFLEERTEGEAAIPLQRATGNPRYRPNEMTKKDKFIHPYSGKQYSGGYSTEIISMGVEHMYSEPVEFATKDPQYFDFIYDLMRGE